MTMGEVWRSTNAREVMMAISTRVRLLRPRHSNPPLWITHTYSLLRLHNMLRITVQNTCRRIHHINSKHEDGDIL